MDVFNLRHQLISDYSSYIGSFINIKDQAIQTYVQQQLNDGILWPDPLIQLNPSFQQGKTVSQLVDGQVLHPTCADIFRFGKSETDSIGQSSPLHQHQEDAIHAAHTGESYVLITGTGSGKSLSYIIPIVDYALKNKHKPGIKAIIIYPMNALANSQLGELEKFLHYGFDKSPVTFARYTGQDNDEARNQIKANPPDILLTNYVMLEYIMTRPEDEPLIKQMAGMQFLVLDELHTYRGRQGADVAMLVRRVRDVTQNPQMQFVGTSATLAGGETFAEQQQQVAETASKIFGVAVQPGRIIGETLTRTTPDTNVTDPEFVARLRQRLVPDQSPPTTRQAFVTDPLSIWIETTFGLETEPGGDRLRRAEPISIETAATQLATLTGLDPDTCAETIRAAFMAGYTVPDGPVFAFRLHQFLSGGDTVYASLDEPRALSLSGQKYVPGSGRSRLFLPLAFCRECGQEYYIVKQEESREDGRFIVERDLGDQAGGELGSTQGFLYRNPEQPWQDQDEQFVLANVPDTWVLEGKNGPKLSATGRKRQPVPLRLSPLGEVAAEGTLYHFMPQPFSFCPNCGVAYHHTLRSDFTKLSLLSAGGRSTATTVLALSALSTLRKQDYLANKARKLLSFTDNRQDASLQAGHTNDFVEVGLIRSALYLAAANAGDAGVTAEELPKRVFEALDLPFELYASDPSVKYGRDEFKRALREVLAYRVYHDLRQGWRVTAPNLEQSGLLKIQYKYLDEITADDEEWQDCHPALAAATAATRRSISQTLLDFMRRELAIKVDYLRPDYQETIKFRSNQRLVEPWFIDEKELMTAATIAYPCTQSALTGARRFENIYISEYGGFGYFLRRKGTFPQHDTKLTLVETLQIIREILERLRRASLVAVVRESEDADGQAVLGYQVQADTIIWQAGDGTVPFHDPIRVPRLPEKGSSTNDFFVSFYREVAATLTNIMAREHTAQVPSREREEREESFREGRLPILYCSPTMELGVDISQLNVVNMRNVPPTPANYAQRSGRAGRSGQPALVFTYCTTGSPHDQYHFKRPSRMVSGIVSPPRLDLANKDLIRAHVHAIWLAETNAKLGKSLSSILDIDQPDILPVQTGLLQQLQRPEAQQRARQRAKRVLDTLKPYLASASWYSDEWLDNQLAQVVRAFQDACDRWRNLFMAAREQQRVQNEIARDPSRPTKDRNIAASLRHEAERQLSILSDERNVAQGDFYSYRYFASEGFLPGYNFPRLPLSAYIQARKGRRGVEDEYVNRPRFLAISEFGPRSIIYYEGSKYVINRVILPVGETDGETTVLTSTAKLCPACGYLHPVDGSLNDDVCDRCGVSLGSGTLHNLFRMQNVSTQRRARISSDEEERLRQGYELITGVRFDEQSSGQQTAVSQDSSGDPLWRMAYGDTATIWRINLGWSRRKNKAEHGFWLDTERGYWQRNEIDPSDVEENPTAASQKRVIPYVQDTKNVLLLEPAMPLEPEVMASLQAVLQKAIQAAYDLEDNELAVEPLPSRDARSLILLYEATEGGAGVLRQLVEEPQAWAEVAREALRISHFDPETGADQQHAPHAHEACEAACYDCLLSYYNQMEHRILDRHLIRDHLLALRDSHTRSSPGATTREEQVRQLRNLTGSDLERDWLDYLEQYNLRLPNKAQHLLAEAGVRPDFFYDVGGVRAAIFVDGPHHDEPAQKETDASNDVKLLSRGIEPIHFHYLRDWEALFKERPDIFGNGRFV